MKINTIAIIGAIIALIGLAFPWWTETLSMTSVGESFSYSYSMYPYQTTASGYGMTMIVQMNYWYGLAAFALLVVGAVLAIALSLIPRARLVIALGGILALLSLIVFAVGLWNDLSTSGISGLGVFSSGGFSELGIGYSYTTYLSVGFWLTLVGAIVIFVAVLRKPKAAAPTAVPPPTPAQQEQARAPTS